MASGNAIDEQEKDLKKLSQCVNEYGSDFVELYYKSMDSKRQDLPKYYTEDAKLIWNGNEIDALNRHKFQLELPDSKHTIDCYDVHPIYSDVNKTSHYMILINVSGSCKHQAYDSKLFFQTFILAVIDSKWKIISDCYRFAE